jgi:hypothetical protein
MAEILPHESAAAALEPLLTEIETAAALRVTDRTIRTWAANGILHVVRIGGVRRYRASDIAALIGPSTDDEDGDDRSLSLREMRASGLHARGNAMQSSEIRPVRHADALVTIEVFERSLLLRETCKDRQLARRVLVAKVVVAVILAVAAIVFGAVGIPIAAGSAGGGCALPSVGSGLDLWRMSRSRSP